MGYKGKAWARFFGPELGFDSPILHTEKFKQQPPAARQEISPDCDKANCTHPDTTCSEAQIRAKENPGMKGRRTQLPKTPPIPNPY